MVELALRLRKALMGRDLWEITEGTEVLEDEANRRKFRKRGTGSNMSLCEYPLPNLYYKSHKCEVSMGLFGQSH